MTIARRGLRTILVEGRAYVWRVRFGNCPCCHHRAVVIADASRRGSVIHLPGPRAMLPETQRTVTPSLIAARIREALAQGWRPGEGGGVYVDLEGA